jgi:hypothetical protein
MSFSRYLIVLALISCSAAGAQPTKRCAEDNRPAACPGGGAASCVDGAWQCKPIPHQPACSDDKRPAACPGGGAASCVDGAWQCKPIPHQ